MSTTNKYTNAYSLDMKQSMNADDAYSFRTQGMISASDAFICDSPGCNAKMTCVNIDKLPHLRKREVHFRTVGGAENHDPTYCSYHSYIDGQKISYVEGSGMHENKLKNLDRDVVFLEKAPLQAPRTISIPNDLDHDIIKRRSKEMNKEKGLSENITRYCRVRPIIQRYLNMDSDAKNNNFIRISSDRISYSDLFFDLNFKRSITALDKKIYFGMGYINLIKDRNIQLKFHHEQKIDSVCSRPSIFISMEQINAYSEMRLFTDILNKCLGSGGCKIDIYAYTAPVLSKDGRYINLPLHSLDHVFFFPRNYADEE